MADDIKLEDGTYIVMNVAASSSAVDGKGKALTISSTNANKFCIRSRQDTGRQFCSVRTEENETVFFYSLFNKVPYVNSFYTAADETANSAHKQGTPKVGAQVYADTYTGGGKCRWKVEHISNTYVNYAGRQYPVFRIINSLSSSTTEEQVEMAAASEGENANVTVQLYAQTTANRLHQWFFLPMEEVPSGYYSIRTAKAVDRFLVEENNKSIVMSSTSNRNDNRGIWAVTQYDPQGRCYLINLETRHQIYVNSKQQRIGGKPQCGTMQNGNESRWMIRAAGISDKYNGAYYNSYILPTPYYVTDTGDNAILDAFYDHPNGNPRIYPDLRRSTGEPKQQWFFAAAEAYDKTLTVPSDLSVDLNDAQNYNIVALKNGSDVFPSWVGKGNAWQCRYRFISIMPSSIAYASGTAFPLEDGDESWRSIFDDSFANDGWGELATYNCDATLIFNGSNSSTRGASGRYRSDYPIHVGNTINVGNEQWYFGSSLTDANCYEGITLEVQVRTWSSSFGTIEGLTSHGGSCSKVFKIVYAPTLTISGLSVSGDGIAIEYSLDYYREGTAIRLSSEGYFNEFEWNNVPNAGTLTIPWFSKYIPFDGDEIPIDWTVITAAGANVSGVSMVTVSSDIDQTDVIEIPESYFDELDNGSRLYRIRQLDSDTAARTWLLIDQRGEGDEAVTENFIQNESNAPYLQVVELPKSDDGWFYIPYPFGKPFSIRQIGYVSAEVSQQLDIPQGLCILQSYFDAKKKYRDKTRMWNWGSYKNVDEWFEIFLNEGENPTESVATNYTNYQTKTTEKAWEVTQFGNTRAQTRSVNGVAWSQLMPDYISRIDAFSACKYAWYRSFDGEVCRVAITDVKEDRKTWGTSIGVDMRRIDG